MPSAAPPPTSAFPSAGLLPKEYTQAASFVRKYPHYDGRGVTVAILDTGVDVAAKGLDRPGKFVDVIDCTGSGDVHLTPVEPLSSAGDAANSGPVIESPTTGRKLRLSSSWKNPTGVWKHGSRPAYLVWPGDLVSRRKAERAKAWDVEHNKLLSAAHQELWEAENAKTSGAKHPETKPATDAAADKAGEPKHDDAASKKAARIEELKARVAVLKELTFDDCGPILEVVAWHDGDHWHAVVGGAEGELLDPTQGWPDKDMAPLRESTLDLSAARPMADFRAEGQHDRFGDADLMTYTVNFLLAEGSPGSADAKLRDAPVVSLVVNSGSHATHVAGIVAAERDDDEGQNGVARGSRLVTMKIGDTRVDGMETQQALLRAASALVALKVDIANLSFGESPAFGTENRGLFVQQLRDVVIRERDVLFVSSAGNNGPALTTLGAPGGTTSGVLSVQAYLHSGAMLEAEYANVEEGSVASNPTTWSSRGPTFDGARGGIYAPGAAITCIPVYCLQATMLANGTSMSSPNACGGIALLLSAMKQEGIPITPERVFKAVRATAKDVSDDLGISLLQVEKAWEYIKAHKERADADFEYRVAVTAAGKPLTASVPPPMRGVYLRSHAETSRVAQFTATVRPTCHSNEKRARYELQLKAAISPSQPWVSAPRFVFLGGNGRSFEIRVDPTKLPEGLSIASVDLYDTEEPGLLLASIPVTVCKPAAPAPTVRYDGIRLDHGRVERKFVAVPAGSTWAEVRFRSSRHERAGTTARFWYHFATPVTSVRLPDAESAALMALNEEEPVTRKIPVRGGETMECALACFHGSAAGFDLSCEIEFHGMAVVPVLGGRDETTIVGGDGLAKFEAASLVRVEELRPQISFGSTRSYQRPTSAEVRPLPFERDVLPSGDRTHQLLLSYQFTQSQEAPAHVTLATPLADHLYDSAVPMLTALFDANKRLVAWGDVYPKPLDLPKGTYTFRVQVLSPSVAHLEKLRHMLVTVDTKLAKPKEANLHLDQIEAYGGGKPTSFKGTKLYPGEKRVFYMDTQLEDLPKEVSAGDLLLGTISLGAGTPDAAKHRIRYLVPPKAKKDNGGGGASAASAGEDKESDDEAMEELLAGVAKRAPEAKREAYVAKLASEHPDSLPILLARLESLRADDASHAERVVEAAEAVLSRVDEAAVLLWQGTKRPPTSEQTPEQRRETKRMEKRRDALKLAHNRKVRALLAEQLKATSSAAAAGAPPTPASPSWDEFRAAFAAYRRLAEESSASGDFAQLHVRWSHLEGRPGVALQQVRKTIKALGNGTASGGGGGGNGGSSGVEELKKARELQRELVEQLGWRLISAKLEREHVVQYPGDITPF